MASSARLYIQVVFGDNHAPAKAFKNIARSLKLLDYCSIAVKHERNKCLCRTNFEKSAWKNNEVVLNAIQNMILNPWKFYKNLPIDDIY